MYRELCESKEDALCGILRAIWEGLGSRPRLPSVLCGGTYGAGLGAILELNERRGRRSEHKMNTCPDYCSNFR